MFEVVALFGFFVEQVFDIKFDKNVYYAIYGGDWRYIIGFEDISTVYEWCYEHRKEGVN